MFRIVFTILLFAWATLSFSRVDSIDASPGFLLFDIQEVSGEAQLSSPSATYTAYLAATPDTGDCFHAVVAQSIQPGTSNYYYRGYAKNCTTGAVFQNFHTLTPIESGPPCPTPSTFPEIPYIYNSSNLKCERTISDCAAGQTIQSGFYNVGTVDTAVLPVLACNNGCSAIASGTASVTRRGLVGGIYNYYAGPADYITNGETCTAGPDVPQSTASIDATGTCAPGQSYATMNGRTICIDSNTGEAASPYSASSVAAAEALNQASLQDAIGAASDAAAASGIDSGTAAAVAAGTAAASQLSPQDLLEQSFCEKNPTDPTCKPPSDFSAPSGSRPDVTQSWYEKKYPNGVGGVMTASFNTMKATPLYSLLDSFRVQVNGSAFDGCFSFTVWNIGDVPLCIPAGVLTFINIVLTITALFAARSIIFGG